MRSPAADFEVDRALVRSLLSDQHPDLANRPLVELGSGWDNTLWRLGSDLLVRLPRRAIAVTLTVNEQRWLAELVPRLPLPVPVPVRVGSPSDAYPWPWSIVPWLDGTPGDRSAVADPDETAVRLARFLRALHRPAPAGAPENFGRGVPIRDRADTFRERLADLSAEIDVAAIRRVWNRACTASPWTGPPVWLHGDLHPANVLIDEGSLAAVIDFGDICAGDPATDLAAAWMLLPTGSISTFLAEYGRVGRDLEARARGWAVLFALMLLSIGLDDRPTYEAVGRSTFEKAIAHPTRA